MIKKCVLFLMVLFTILVKGQDVITLKTGDQIEAKVLEVGTDEIKYKKFGIEDGPIYSIKKSDVDKINYQNGTADIFSDKTNAPQQSQTDATEYYIKGGKDAEKYYASFSTPAATGTFWTSLLIPIGGLIPAIACSSTPPKDKNLHMPPTPLTENTNYMKGYRDEAYTIKKRRVWLNFGIGAAVGIIGTILLENAK